MVPPPPSLAAATTLGPVQLTVADLPGVAAFYERVVGLRGDGPPLVGLVGEPDAPPRAPRASGLFHLALLVPSRAELALALRRIVAAGWPLSGASDHLVSEALYLRDPEGNGIEIYRDRPREQWRRRGDELEMATLPLDLDGLLAELPAGDPPDEGLAPGTRIGHVHLEVSELAPAAHFYHETLGFEVTVRSYPGALFVAAGGYHHHVGLNTWSSAGGPRATPGTRGLRRFTVVLPSREERDRVAQRAAVAGFPPRADEGGVLVTDPFGNDVLLTAPDTPADARGS